MFLKSYTFHSEFHRFPACIFENLARPGAMVKMGPAALIENFVRFQASRLASCPLRAFMVCYRFVIDLHRFSDFLHFQRFSEIY